MLITKEVEVNAYGKSIEYYENLGYEIPRVLDKQGNYRVKRGTKIKVKTEDLSDGVNILIEYKCDICETIHKRRWNKLKQERNNCNELELCEQCLFKYKRLTPFKDIIKILSNKNYKPLFSEFDYIKNPDSLPFICLNHPEDGIQYTNYQKLYGVNHICKKCICEDKSERYRREEKEVLELFNDNNLILEDNAKYINMHTLLPCRCKFHPDKLLHISFRNLHKSAYGVGCEICNPRNMWSKGENNINWKGGISSLSEHLRATISPWKQDSMKNCDYKCIMTGDKFDVIHHLYGFSSIIEEALDILKFPIYQYMNQYSEKELKLLEKVTLELHYKYGLEVCLTKEYHDLFHQLYGNKYNTPDQFEDFRLKIEQSN